MASRKPSTEIPARRAPRSVQEERDAQFQALLRAACVKAAGVGALSALIGAVPGAGLLLRFSLGELADAAAVGAIQEKLIEDTLALYELPLPDALRKPLIAQISALGAGASLGVDAIGRRILGRFGRAFGGTLFGRVAPVVGILSSAIGNAATTYAIGRRAESFAKMGAAPADSLADALRAFTGLDERRVWEWSVTATQEALGVVGRVSDKFKALNPFSRWEMPDGDAAEADDAETSGADAGPATAKPRAARGSTKRPGAAKKATAKTTRKATAAATKKSAGPANATRTRTAAKKQNAEKPAAATARKPARPRSPRGSGEA